MTRLTKIKVVGWTLIVLAFINAVAAWFSPALARMTPMCDYDCPTGGIADFIEIAFMLAIAGGLVYQWLKDRK